QRLLYKRTDRQIYSMSKSFALARISGVIMQTEALPAAEFAPCVDGETVFPDDFGVGSGPLPTTSLTDLAAARLCKLRFSTSFRAPAWRRAWSAAIVCSVLKSPRLWRKRAHRPPSRPQTKSEMKRLATILRGNIRANARLLGATFSTHTTLPPQPSPLKIGSA